MNFSAGNYFVTEALSLIERQVLIIGVCIFIIIICRFPQVWIAWFGDGATFSMVDVACIKPLEEGIKLRKHNKKKLPKKLQEAIKHARDALKTRAKKESSS